MFLFLIFRGPLVRHLAHAARIARRADVARPPRQVGLLLMQAWVPHLDTALLLEARHNLGPSLLSLQCYTSAPHPSLALPAGASATTPASPLDLAQEPRLILDLNSLARGQLLERLGAAGGPEERRARETRRGEGARAVEGGSVSGERQAAMCHQELATVVYGRCFSYMLFEEDV